MASVQLNGRVPKHRSTGRPRKGGTLRRVVQARMPAPLQEALVDVAAESSLAVTDLGAYYLIQGWNQTRQNQGLDPIPMPLYLEEAVRPHLEAERHATLLDEAEESLLAG